MENDQEESTCVCKVCGKTFPSGRSLGGHIRSHLIDFTISNLPSKKKKKKMKFRYGVEEKQSSDAFLQQKRCFRSFDGLFRQMNNKCSSDPTVSILEMSDQPEPEEEVAVSLLMLSNDWYLSDSSVLESSYKTPREDAKEMEVPCRDDDSKKKKGKLNFTCAICLKSFSSYQALGGHRASHKIRTSHNKCTAHNAGDDHQCPICFRVFHSGQALGGHKRSHFVSYASKTTARLVIRNSVSRILDLNMPAPIDEEDHFSSDVMMQNT